MIETIEMALIEQVRSQLGDKLRDLGSLPGPLGTENLRELTRAAPAVFFAWLGGRQRPASHDIEIAGTWGMYVFTAHASGHVARRHGRGNDIGAYEILATVMPALNGYTIDGAGTVALRNVENLFSLHLETREAAAIYAAVFEVPLPMDYELDLSTLADFTTFHAEHSLPGADEPAAVDEVTLPQ